MRSMLKQALGESSLRHFLRRMRQSREYRAWRSGDTSRPIPHLVKQLAVREYARAYDARVLVETGTYLGDMMFAMRNDFDALYSIELSDELYHRAGRRFAGLPQIHLLNGDSSRMLPRVLAQFDQRAVFWLDGHYSGGITARGAKETPIFEELIHIFEHKVHDHVVLIDDGRLFVGAADYPTLAEVEALVAEHRPGWSVTLRDDIIRIAAPLSQARSQAR